MDSDQKVWLVISRRYSVQAAFLTMQDGLDFLAEKSDDDLGLYWVPLISSPP